MACIIFFVANVSGSAFLTWTSDWKNGVNV